jgi:hypothetical protein
VNSIYQTQDLFQWWNLLLAALHKDYDRKGSIAKKKIVSDKRLGAKTN